MTKKFALTEENCKRYLAMHPNAKTVSGGFFRDKYKTWIEYSGSSIALVFDDGEVGPGGSISHHPEFEFPPLRYYFKNTPENIAAHKKKFPGVFEKFESKNGRAICEMIGMNPDGSISGDSDESYYKYQGRIEYTFDDAPQDKPLKQLPEGYYFRATQENVDAVLKEYPDTVQWDGNKPHHLEGLCYRSYKYCSGKSSSYTEYKFQGAVSQDSAASVVAQDQSSSVKDEDMLSSQEVQQIVEALKGTKEITNKTSITRRALGFAGRTTRRSLGYVFAPAARWTQNIIFLAATSGVLYGGYKVYDYVSNISLPRIVWDSKFLDNERSPSDR
jgi:hypothetical protein